MKEKDLSEFGKRQIMGITPAMAAISTGYKLSKEIPAIYSRIKEVFNVEFKDIVIAYGDTIYCVDDLPMHTIAHECVHLEQQQAMGVEEWWDEYIKSRKFRFDQELVAYRAEVKYLRTHPEEMTRDIRRQWTQKFAELLSGPLYGNLVSLNKAKELLTLW